MSTSTDHTKRGEKLLHRLYIPFLPARLVRLINKFETFVLYSIIGGMALIIDVGLFTALDGLTELSVVISNALSMTVAMLYSFVMNAYFNFRTRTGLAKRFISFTLITGLGFIISSAMLWVLSEIMGLNSVLVKSMTLPVVFLVQFSLNSKFTFKKEENHEDYVLESIR